MSEKENLVVKAAFFDIDGTLAVPRFDVDGKIVPGMNKERWIQYNIENEDPYRLCGIPKNVKILLRFLKHHGVDLNVLSNASCNVVKQNKTLFINTNYSRYFYEDNIHFIDGINFKNKKEYLYDYCKRNELTTRQVFVLDDDYKFIIELATENFNTHHISEMLDYHVKKDTDEYNKLIKSFGIRTEDDKDNTVL